MAGCSTMMLEEKRKTYPLRRLNTEKLLGLLKAHNEQVIKDHVLRWDCKLFVQKTALIVRRSVKCFSFCPQVKALTLDL